MSIMTSFKDIQRIEDASKYRESWNQIERAQYDEKSENIGGIDSYVLVREKNSWSNEPNLLPSVAYPGIVTSN